MAFDAGAVIGRLELNIAGWQQSVEKVKADQASLSGLVMRHEQQFKSLGKTLAVVGAAIVASLGAMVKKTADYGDEMDEMHQRTGASVELLTGLDGVLKKNGASTQDLAIGMKFLSGKMVDANSGNKEAIALFQGLGISVTDANGNLRSTTDVLFDVATRFAGMENGAVKTTAAVDLFGRGGMSLIPTLNLGADGLKRETEEAQRLGKVMTAEAAKACSDFNDSLVNLKGGLQGVGIQIGQALMPTVQDFVKGITDVVIKVVAWTKSHEDLTRISATTTLAVGGIAMALGPMLYMLPGLVKGWQTLVAVLKLSTAGLAASVVGLTAVVAAAGIAYDIVTRLTKAKNDATDADYAAFEANHQLGQKLREVADAAGLTRAEFFQLTQKYNENNAAMAMAIKRGAEGKALQEALATIGKEHAAVIEEQKKKMAEMDPVTRALQDAMSKLGKETKTLAEQLDITFRADVEARIKKLNEALLMYRGKMTEEQVAKIRAEIESLSQSMKTSLVPAADEVAKHINSTLVSLENMALKAMEEIGKVGDFTADNMAADLDKIAAGWKEAGSKVATETKSFMQEVSTVVADAMRDIARSIVEVLNLKELLGATPKKITFDSSYYDAMVAAATSAYDEIVAKTKTAYSAMEAAANKSYDAAVNAANNAYDKQEARITLHQQIEDRQRSWTETFEDRKIARQDEREDRAIQRQYDRDDAKFARQHQKEVDAINNSTMTAAQKEAAIAKLERKYEHEKDVREMQRQHAADVREMKRQHAADVRQRAREHAALVRDLKRQREKEARELAHERRLEALELAHEAKLEAIRAAGLAKLLGLQNAHQADLDKIRRDEDAARKKQADDEEARQKSLWYKVKGIFATAVEQMLTIWLTRFVTGLVSGTATAATGIGNIVSGAATSLATILTTLATTIGTIITTIFTAIGTAIVTLATAIGAAAVALAVSIGTVIVTLATAVATAATILAAAAPAFVIVGLIAVGIFATIALLKRLIAGAGGTGAGDGMGRVVERQDIQTGLLTMIRDTLQNGILPTLWTISGHTANLISIKTSNWVISTATQISRDFLRTIAHYQTLSAGYLKTSRDYLKTSRDYLKTSTGYLKTIAEKISGLTSAAFGAISTRTELMVVHGTPSDPEYVLRASQLRTGMMPQTAGGAGVGAGGQVVNHYSINIQAIDGPSVERLFKGKGREIIDDMFRQNKGGLTRNVNRYLETMA